MVLYSKLNLELENINYESLPYPPLILQGGSAIITSNDPKA